MLNRENISCIVFDNNNNLLYFNSKDFITWTNYLILIILTLLYL